MNVSFSIGEQSKAVIEKIKTSADSVDFYSYPTIQDMIKEATLRHINFKRVIFSTKILKDVEGDLRVLNEFIRNYSNSTEIVMIILDKNNTEYDEVFSAIFNSPLYTPAFMSKATVTNLVSLVQDNIEDIRAKFYSLDKGVKDKMIVSSSATGSSEAKKAQESSQLSPDPQKEEKKGGFLSGLFGGKKKTSRNQEIAPEIAKPVTEATKVAETVTEKVEDFSNGPQSVFTGFGGVSDTFGNSSENNSSQNIFDPNGSSSPVGDEDFTSKNSEIEDDEEDFLSVGDYGEQHSDTGFLDEEEEDDDPELKAFLASKKGQPETLTEDDINEDDANYKVNPPLRTNKDKDMLIKGLKDGTIDIIATDHAPHSKDEKAKEFKAAPSGMIGLETSLALGITNLVKKGYLTLEELLTKMTVNPAKLYKMDKGCIEAGKIADLVIFNPDEEWEVTENFVSKASNSPFIGQKLYGKIKYTICNGNVVYKDLK